jgi:hypothetical protein
MLNLKLAVLVTVFAIIASVAHADSGGFFNSGGSLGSTTVANPPGTLSISGSALTFTSNDGSMAIHATFVSPAREGRDWW